MKVVINRCYGGFHVSDAALELLGIEYSHEVTPDNPKLIELIESRGSEFVSGEFSRLAVVDVPYPYYEIRDYNGFQSIIASDSPIVRIG